MIRQQIRNIWTLCGEIVYRCLLVVCLLLESVVPATEEQKAQELLDAFQSLPF